MLTLYKILNSNKEFWVFFNIFLIVAVQDHQEANKLSSDEEVYYDSHEVVQQKKESKVASRAATLAKSTPSED